MGAPSRRPKRQYKAAGPSTRFIRSEPAGSFVEKGGWATLPGGDASDYTLAQACATMLSDAK
jgi:hypothetical protein